MYFYVHRCLIHTSQHWGASSKVLMRMLADGSHCRLARIGCSVLLIGQPVHILQRLNHPGVLPRQDAILNVHQKGNAIKLPSSVPIAPWLSRRISVIYIQRGEGSVDQENQEILESDR